MAVDTVQKQLEVYGPERCDTLSVEQARLWCRRLARRHYENFSVLSSLLPSGQRVRGRRRPAAEGDDYAALYAFCRWADDLGDEIGDRTRSLELLAWWRRELEQC
ncbi:MAG: squalene/phytoene synthase family protein, partial [Planctomycetota bacterium]